MTWTISKIVTTLLSLSQYENLNVSVQNFEFYFNYYVAISTYCEDKYNSPFREKLWNVYCLQILSKEPQANIVVSPLSLATLLSILQQGAVDNSNAQLEHVLHQSKEESKESYGRIVQSLKVYNSMSCLHKV